MAKVIITIDTDEKNDDKESVIHASIDGEDIPNMSDVHINKFGEFISVELTAIEFKEGDVFLKRTTFSAFAAQILEETGIKLILKESKGEANLTKILEKLGKKHWSRS